MYNLAPVFRAGERSPRHNIEFTMLEWYDVGASMDQTIEQTVALVDRLLQKGRPRIVTYRQLFQETLGFDPIDAALDVLEKQTAGVDEQLARSLRGQRDELLDVLMTERVEPLICQEMVLIKNYPLSQAALARQSDEDPQTAERFELIVEGLELANGYGELLDADTLLVRNEVNQKKRLATGRKPLPQESRLVDAMRRGMPACSGVALGFDRVVMLALGTRDIADVLAFPIEEA
jgi:elongation factor P--(R)-beta-lysine ligase